MLIWCVRAQGSSAYAVERLVDALKGALTLRVRPLRPGQPPPKHSSQQLYALLTARVLHPCMPAACSFSPHSATPPKNSCDTANPRSSQHEHDSMMHHT